MMQTLEGKTLSGQYYLRKRVGGGGQADVYQAWDRLRSTQMAVKVLLYDNHQDDQIRTQIFMKEAEWMRKLEHPYIVRLYETMRDSSILYMVMEWIEGPNLRQLLNQKNQPLPTSEATRILQPICIALNFSHQKSIFHCDIKPANIMLSTDGRVLLTDFGVARLASQRLGAAGTPAYMSPEQITNARVDARTDIYSLGVTMFEIFSGGVLPFQGKQAPSNISQLRKRVEYEHCYINPPDLRTFNPGLSGPIAEIVNRALAKDPNLRFSSAMELWNEFEQALKYSGAKSHSQTELLVTTFLANQNNQRIDSSPIKPNEIRNLPSLDKVTGPFLIGLTGEWSGHVFPLSTKEVTIGRSLNQSLCIPDPMISRQHATILVGKKGVYIRDEASKAGTYVNNGRVIGVQMIKSGDTIRIGNSWSFEFRIK